LNSSTENEEVRHYLRQHSDRAKFFIDCMYRRWRTLKRVAELIVDYQREFLEKGVRYLRPLTRAEVATHLNLDEGTVSRATANKYALLPNGRLMPISDFFDGSLGVKDVLRELIATEEPKRRLSDDELARLLSARGIPMARRTVTKYREEMGIVSSRER
jgi:RNA polymerase sigma-54 factor